MTDFSIKPTLTGESVILRPLDEGDFEALMTAMDDPEVTRLTGSRGDIEEDFYREWLRTRKDQDDRLDLAIVERATGTCVGESVMMPGRICEIAVLRASSDPGQIRLTYVMTKKASASSGSNPASSSRCSPRRCSASCC